MRAFDTNVLVYAFLSDSPHHRAASSVLREAAEGAAPWAIPWPCIHEFLAVVTNARVFGERDLSAAARAQVAAWSGSPSLRLVAETSAHGVTLDRLLASSGVRGARVHDARIAAICLDHRVDELVTNDRDFAAFPELRIRALSSL